MKNRNCKPHKGKSQKRQREYHEPWLWPIWAVLSLLFLPPWPRQVLWTILSRKERTTKYGGDGLRRWLESAPRTPPGNHHQSSCKPSGGPNDPFPNHARLHSDHLPCVRAPHTDGGARACCRQSLVRIALCLRFGRRKVETSIVLGLSAKRRPSEDGAPVVRGNSATKIVAGKEGFEVTPNWPLGSSIKYSKSMIITTDTSALLLRMEVEHFEEEI